MSLLLLAKVRFDADCQSRVCLDEETVTAIHNATSTDPASVRAFLDSRYGRHFADGVNSQMHYGASLADAIAKTTAEWMGWRITPRTSRETGIPAGLPYLTGFVINEGIAAEAQD